MTPAELAQAIDGTRARLQSTKRALKVLQGQQRNALQLLAVFDDDLASLRSQLESTAEEAKEHEQHFSGTQLFV